MQRPTPLPKVPGAKGINPTPKPVAINNDGFFITVLNSILMS
jgi:hypothetical protein